MKITVAMRRAFEASAAAALLAGCGATQPPVSEPGGTSSTPSTATGPLIYAADTAGEVYVVSYPTGTVVGSFSIKPDLPLGLCSDSSGNVFVIAEYSGNRDYIYEYAHGGVSAIATLSLPQYDSFAFGCARDATTGNLAVINDSWNGAPGNVEIFPNAQGNPTTYSVSNWTTYEGLSYDGGGNLFVDGGGGSSPYQLAELPVGASGFQGVTLNETLSTPYFMQPVPNGLAIQTFRNLRRNRGQISLIALSASGGTVTKTIDVHDWKYGGRGFNIFGRRLISICPSDALCLWRYPGGGRVLERIGEFSEYPWIYAFALSVESK